MQSTLDSGFAPEIRPLSDAELERVSGGVSNETPPIEIDGNRSIRIDRAYRK